MLTEESSLATKDSTFCMDLNITETQKSKITLACMEQK